jgi:A-macroglobulin TED domain/Alpha-2-macroglobulin family/MG2 domain/A-macroglobulin receptor binding domain/Alpha-2-macroglobulin bait region domain/Macroglobulin domain MG3
MTNLLRCTLLGALPCLLLGAAPAQGLPTRAAVDAYVLGPQALVTGSKASYRVAVHWASAPGRSGPLPGALVRLSLRSKQSKAQRGQQRGQTAAAPRHLVDQRTDRAGAAHFRFDVPRIKAGAYELRFDVVAPQGKTRRVTEVQIYPGGRVLLTTDKSLYQPGQTIHVRALALRSVDLRPVARARVQLRIKDPRGTVVFARAGKTSRFGVAALDFELAHEINLGAYSVEARVEGADDGDWSSRSVSVKRYVLPRFKVGLETERSFYRPGETVRGSVSARYFFGKPLVGGQVLLDVRGRLGQRMTKHVLGCSIGSLRRGCKLDSSGRMSFDLKLGRPEQLAADAAGELRVRARVTDVAGRAQWADLSLPYSPVALQLSVVPENDRLVRGVANRVHVVAGYPDGRPAVGARVSLRVGQRAPLSASTDALGVATVRLDVGLNRGDRSSVTLALRLRDRLGEQITQRVSLPLAPRGALLLRPQRSIVEPGAQVQVVAHAAAAGRFNSGRQIYLDVVKAGQTLATYTRPLRGGRAAFSFRPDPALFGLLELRGYRLLRTGERVGTSRMIYVEHPGRLVIKASADKPSYRPGQRARISFKVTDSRSGEGVEAALGVRAVDAAVAALGGLKLSAPKVFFTLASQADDHAEPDVRPGGRDLAHWVSGEQRAARAADVLLAALRPLEGQTFETNPWKERREAWEEQAPELLAAALKFIETHFVGQRTARGWRFHPRLVPRMARAGAIKRAQVADPWQRTVRPRHLRRHDASFVFAPHAARMARERLERIYDTLVEVQDKLSLKGEPVPKLDRESWPRVIPRRILSRLVRAHKLARSDTLDPWGSAYRVIKHHRWLVDAYEHGFISRYVIRSAGPDGRHGTRDDVVPPGPRKRVRVHGPRYALGADAARHLSMGGGGTGSIGCGGSGMGYGRGVGRLGARRARAPRVVSGSAAMPARVRAAFPETLIWRPELVTDAHGAASLDVKLADNITTWKVAVVGSTEHGLLGSASLEIKAFQDFFVELDLPGNLTQGDRISVPVTVHNYLKTPQTVLLKLQPDRRLSVVGARVRQIKLGPSQVRAVRFVVLARGVGPAALTVRARAVGTTKATASATADAVRRSTHVAPDGVERAVSFAGTLSGAAGHDLKLSPRAIPGTRKVLLKIMPGAVSQTIVGMESMLHMPSGCFEQTSSTTYPNVLVLDYLQRNKLSSPSLARKARRFINAGYQRLLRFEVAGGGFSLYGQAPADTTLSAFGLQEFVDMARVHSVDPALLKRTQAWLVGQQQKDGSWRPGGRYGHRALTEGPLTLRVTAYVAQALHRSGYRGVALRRAKEHLLKRLSRARDPYTLSLVGRLLTSLGQRRSAQTALKRLWALRRSTEHGILFAAPRTTLTHGSGRSGQIETTALAALALLDSPKPPLELHRVLDQLVASKDSRGAWHSTQATILSLQALLLQQRRVPRHPRGRVQVRINNQPRATVALGDKEAEVHQLDLTRHVRAGANRIELRFEGRGQVQYHLTGHHWLPRQRPAARARRKPAPAPSDLQIWTHYSQRKLAPGQPLKLEVYVRNRGARRVRLPLVSIPLPPGFTVDEDRLVALAGHHGVEKVQRVGDRALLYLDALTKGQSRHYTLHLESRQPLRVQARPAVVYEYYRPENRAQSRVKRLHVAARQWKVGQPACDIVIPGHRIFCRSDE